nr:MAG TPA: hypothetical protein [Caudoviricetes sp.]
MDTQRWLLKFSQGFVALLFYYRLGTLPNRVSFLLSIDANKFGGMCGGM